jgi:hypothetical protein
MLVVEIKHLVHPMKHIQRRNASVNVCCARTSIAYADAFECVRTHCICEQIAVHRNEAEARQLKDRGTEVDKQLQVLEVNTSARVYLILKQSIATSLLNIAIERIHQAKLN